MNGDAVAEFLTELACGIPPLPRAACRAHRDVFDSPDPADIDRAVGICGRCPEFERCRRWAEAQRPRTLTGVVAGVDRTYTFRPTKKEI